MNTGELGDNGNKVHILLCSFSGDHSICLGSLGHHLYQEKQVQWLEKQPFNKTGEIGRKL